MKVMEAPETAEVKAEFEKDGKHNIAYHLFLDSKKNAHIYNY